jgi:hypothetical protein
VSGEEWQSGQVRFGSFRCLPVPHTLSLRRLSRPCTERLQLGLHL